MRIPFNQPFVTGDEMRYIQDVVQNGQLSGNGRYTKRCHDWLTQNVGCQWAFLTHSGTAALEMAALLAEIQPGDEIIMPSFTFVSTANAFVLRGGVPVFVDIRPDTMNIDETLIESAVTERTKAIVPVHYAGVSCDMEKIGTVAKRHGLLVIEDAAHGMMARYKERPLGSLGDLAAVSFHETKNIISGEGGALMVNNSRFSRRAEIIWEKGTNRAEFFRGEINKYTWVDLGSSFLPGELTAAYLWAQLEHVQPITERRLKIWESYHRAFEAFERDGVLRRPVIPDGLTHNGHIYYLLLPDLRSRTALINGLREAGIHAVFHYVPLDNSPAGIRYARVHGKLTNTRDIGDRLVRMPLWVGMEPFMDDILDITARVLKRL